MKKPIESFKKLDWKVQLTSVVLTGLVCFTAVVETSVYVMSYDDHKRMAIHDREQEDIAKITANLNKLTEDMQITSKNLEHLQLALVQKQGRLTREHITNDVRIIDTGNYVGLDNRPIPPSRAGVTRPSIDTFMIKSKSAITAKELEYCFEGTGLEGTGKAFVKAEMVSGINAMFMASLAMNESGMGRSSLARNKNNLFGFGANDGNPYGDAYSFDSKDECIMYVAKFLREHYVDGSYYRGGTIPAVNSVYASDPDWSWKVWNNMLWMERKIQDM